jgi:hypothetical protein
MKPTLNQKHNPELFAEATTKGHELGVYVASMGWVKADLTIARAATGYVNRLPLNNIKLEKELRDAFLSFRSCLPPPAISSDTRLCSLSSNGRSRFGGTVIPDTHTTALFGSCLL